jgi:hypothetical protein
MKQRGFGVLVAVVLLVGALACSVGGLGTVRGSGNVTQEERPISHFSGVTLAALGNLYIETGDEEALTIEAEENLLPYFEATVTGDMLKIKTRDGVNLDPTAPVNFYLTVKEIDTLVLAGGGNIEAPALQADKFTVESSGSGDIEIASVTADSLEVQLSGSGTLRASGGRVDEQTVSISGSGKYEARDLQSNKADVTISGSGSMTINVRQNLEVNISGSGSVRYVGSPTLDKMTVSGTGTIEQIGD